MILTLTDDTYLSLGVLASCICGHYSCVCVCWAGLPRWVLWLWPGGVLMWLMLESFS